LLSVLSFRHPDARIKHRLIIITGKIKKAVLLFIIYKVIV
jgi:hypothetical protein